MRDGNGGSYMTAGEHYKCEHECHDEQRLPLMEIRKGRERSCNLIRIQAREIKKKPLKRCHALEK